MKGNIGKPITDMVQRNTRLNTVFTSLFALVFFLALGGYVYYGILGINFGNHWDERKLLGSIEKTLQTGILLPGWYNYPSLSYLVSMIVSSPYIVGSLLLGVELDEMAGLARELDIYHGDLKLSIRVVFFLISLLGTFAIYAATRLCGVGQQLSLVAAILSLCSFQLFYHARWIAPDTLLYSTAALTLAAGLWAQKRRSKTSLVVAAICASLALSAKYPGGLFLLIPLYLANREGWSSSQTFTVLAVFIGVFLMITPGCFVDSVRFGRDVIDELTHYSVEGHGVHTIERGFGHFVRIGDFLLFRATSPSPYASFLVAALAIVGGFWVAAKNRQLLVVLCAIPVIYVVYFSTQKVMIVRNLLMLLPFIWVLAALALQYFVQKMGPMKGLSIVLILVSAMAFASMQHFRITTGTLAESSEQIKKNTEEFIESAKGKTIGVSNGVVAMIAEEKFSERIVESTEKVDILVFLKNEIKVPKREAIKPPYLGAFANRRGVYKVIAGANEVDVDYYPDWSGKDRVVAVEGLHAELLRAANMRSIGIYISSAASPETAQP